VTLLLNDPDAPQTTMAPEVEAGHGRIETRTATVSTEIKWLQEQYQWPGLEAVGKVVRVRETAEKTTAETAYCLLSKPLTPEQLKTSMNEDQLRTRMGNGPHNRRCCDTWPSTPCRRKGRKVPCEESSNEPDGTTTSSTGYWRCFEMRLPGKVLGLGDNSLFHGRKRGVGIGAPKAGPAHFIESNQRPSYAVGRRKSDRKRLQHQIQRPFPMRHSYTECFLQALASQT